HESGRRHDCHGVDPADQACELIEAGAGRLLMRRKTTWSCDVDANVIDSRLSRVLYSIQVQVEPDEVADGSESPVPQDRRTVEPEIDRLVATAARRQADRRLHEPGGGACGRTVAVALNARAVDARPVSSYGRGIESRR